MFRGPNRCIPFVLIYIYIYLWLVGQLVRARVAFISLAEPVALT